MFLCSFVVGVVIAVVVVVLVLVLVVVVVVVYINRSYPCFSLQVSTDVIYNKSEPQFNQVLRIPFMVRLKCA